MKQIVFSLFFLWAFFSCVPAVTYEAKVSDALHELDRTIKNKPGYEQIKEQRILGIRGLLRNIDSPRHVYSIYDNLYQEYYRYNLDSAMAYAWMKSELAYEIGDKVLIDKSTFDIVGVFLMAGMLNEAKEEIDRISFDALDPSLRMDYYDACHNFYREMKAICIYPSIGEVYDRKIDEYREKVYKLVGNDEIRKSFIEATEKRKRGQHRSIVESLIPLFEKENVSDHNKAGLAYVIARAYQEMGETDRAIYYYAQSAIYDIHTPVHEHVAMYKLAAILYEKGDMERAYRYINNSMDDALKINSRKNVYSMNQLLPLISQSYNVQIQQHQRKLIALIGGISFLMLMLAIAIIVVYASLKRVSATKREQNRTNAELKEVNYQLTGANNTLLESNHIKDAYLGRYLDMCSNYINGVEQYRSHLNHIMRKDGGGEVLRTIKTATYIKEELDKFYMNFDATFLHLFPDFVKQFNALLQEDKRISLKQGELLNTELRVFALIRLGITDSVKIAEFLRRSSSTIYNYRVKMRNAAINERQDFEKQVSNIGSII